jgi:hypothetical protein
MIISRNVLFVVAMMLFSAQSAFAQFEIAIVNDSKFVYREVYFNIAAEGFDAAFGHMSLDTSDISPGASKKFVRPYKYRDIPLTKTFIPRKNCDLNIIIVAIPESIDIDVQKLEVNNVLNQLHKEQEIILEDKPTAYGYPMSGVKPPDILITITDYGIEFAELIQPGPESEAHQDAGFIAASTRAIVTSKT